MDPCQRFGFGTLCLLVAIAVVFTGSLVEKSCACCITGNSELASEIMYVDDKPVAFVDGQLSTTANTSSGILRNSPYSAVVANELVSKAVDENIAKLYELEVPSEFTLSEREFFDHIWSSIRWDAKHMSNSTKLFMGYDYCEWTGNIITFLTDLGYSVDIAKSEVSWED